MGAKHAARWVRTRRAVFLADGTLRLTPEFRRALGLSKVGQSLFAGVGYDEVRRSMRTDERRHIPVREPMRGVTKRKIAAAHAGPAGRVRVLYCAESTAAEG